MKQLLAPLEMEQYQDIWVRGRCARPGVRECHGRYAIMRDFCRQYKRPFTVLDVGSCLCYFSIRLAEDFDCTAFCIEGYYAAWAKQILEQNDNPRVILVRRQLVLDDLKLLAEVEHFDVVLAMSVIHHLDGDYRQSLKVLRSLGDHLILELPHESNACGQDIVRQIHDQELPEDAVILGHAPSHLDNSQRQIVLLSQAKRSLQRAYLGSLNGPCQMRIESSFERKIAKFPRKDKARDWYRGINLQSYLRMGGVYPPATVIAELLRSRGVPKEGHGDIRPWNIIMQGDALQFIDQHDHDAYEEDERQLATIIHTLGM